MRSMKMWSWASVCAACLVLARAQFPRSHPEIKTSGRNLFVDGAPWYFKGICWNPVGYNGTQPDDLDFAGFVEVDGDMFKSAGINAVRTYEPILDLSVLDKLWERGVFVVQQVYIWGENEPGDDVAARVNAVKDHPAILMWEVGNEWNYNNLYQYGNNGMNKTLARDRVKRAVDIIKANDPNHPVASNLGEIAVFEDPDYDLFNVLSNVDVWGLNVYRNASFFDIFAKWKTLSNMPMYIGEYGVDAWDARPEVSAANMKAHADGTRWLTEELIANSTIYGGAAFGGFLFEFADEWWKDGAGRGDDWHDVGGSAPGGGPYPDITFNEEWWGLVDLWRSPRPAWYEYAKFLNPVAGYCRGSIPGTTMVTGMSCPAVASAAIPSLRMKQDTPSDTDLPTKFLMNL